MPGIQFGQDLDLNGNAITELGPGVAGTDAVNLNQLNAVAPAGFSTTIGDGVASTFDVLHSLGTTDVMVQVYEVSSGDQWFVEASTDGVDNVDITFGFVPTAGQFRVQVIPVP